MSGKWFNAVPYGVRREDQLIDMDEVRRIALEHRPKLIIAGATAYPRHWDFAAFRRIADEVGAYLLADMSHFSGLVAGGAHPSPFSHAHIVTTTTHKSLRGPRSGIILWDDEALSKRLNMAVFPGLQGGPAMHLIAAKAVAFGEALRPEFKIYARSVVENAKALAASLEEHGLRIVSGGTDNHLMLVDCRPLAITGKAAEDALGKAGITVNKNQIPFDPEKPNVSSGVRIGTPAITTRGMQAPQMQQVAGLIVAALKGAKDDAALVAVKAKVKALATAFPLYRSRL
jgi:glycine hydroxymethyltransferase